MYKKNTVVSCGGAEAENVLLDAGLRMESLPAQQLLDCVWKHYIHLS